MGKHGERSMTTQLKLLLPGSFEKKLRISDELAECFYSRDGGAMMTALLVSPFGRAVWKVEVGGDGDGAFLGRRWPEFVEAHGISLGWFLVLRHIGRGMLAVKAFDGTCLIKEFGQILTVPGLPAAKIETGRARMPQFIMPLCPEWMKKMPIPAEFLKRRYISDEDLNRRMATFVTPFRDFWHIHLEKDGLNVFFAGDWSKFLEFQGISEGEALLIRYQGNMIFTIEVFGFTGCRRNLKKNGIRFQQTENSENTDSFQETENNEETNTSHKTEPSKEVNSFQEKHNEEGNSSYKTKQIEETNSSQKHIEVANSSQKTEQSSEEAQSQKEAHISSRKRKQYEEQIMPKSSRNSPDIRTRVDGIQSRLLMTTYALTHYLILPRCFYKELGFHENCKITLKSLGSKRSWEVNYLVQKKGQCILSRGWRMFCQYHRLKEDDACTFNVIKKSVAEIGLQPGAVVGCIFLGWL